MEDERKDFSRSIEMVLWVANALYLLINVHIKFQCGDFQSLSIVVVYNKCIRIRVMNYTCVYRGSI